jgi:hypothetical protein
MKKQINPTIKAHLIRSAFYVLLLIAVCVIPFALAQRKAKQSVAASRSPVFPTAALSALAVPDSSAKAIALQKAARTALGASASALGAAPGRLPFRRPPGQRSAPAHLHWGQRLKRRS